MAEFLVRFTPLEPYFFGGDKNFSFTKEEENYFIFSRYFPHQTTFLGALRYLFLPEKNPRKVKDYAHLVGKESFDVSKSEAQDFGVIQKLSPFFLLRGEEILVRTPMDHQMGNAVYTPFTNYQSLLTNEGEKEYTEDYDAKKGIADGFVSLYDKRVYSLDELIKRQTKVSMHWTEDGKPMVLRREYCRLEKEYSFALFGELSLSDEELTHNHIVYLGQTKSAFCVQFQKAEGKWLETQENIAALLNEKTVYCFGDVLASHSIYETVSFSVTELSSYRSFMTKEDSIHKGERLYHLLRSGSIFRCSDEEFSSLSRQLDVENYRNIGWNHIIRGTK